MLSFDSISHGVEKFDAYPIVLVGGFLTLIGHSLELRLGEKGNGVEGSEGDIGELGDLKKNFQPSPLRRPGVGS